MSDRVLCVLYRNVNVVIRHCLYGLTFNHNWFVWTPVNWATSRNVAHYILISPGVRSPLRCNASASKHINVVSISTCCLVVRLPIWYRYTINKYSRLMHRKAHINLLNAHKRHQWQLSGEIADLRYLRARENLHNGDCDFEAFFICGVGYICRSIWWQLQCCANTYTQLSTIT